MDDILCITEFSVDNFITVLHINYDLSSVHASLSDLICVLAYI